MLHDAIQMSYLSFVAGFLFVLFTLFNSVIPVAKKKYFLIGTVIALTMIVCNFLMLILDGNPAYQWLYKFVLAVSYSISGPVMIPIILITSVIRPTVRKIIRVFASSNLILSFLSMFNGWIFDVHEDGTMTLGKLVLVPIVLTAFYVSLIIYSSLIKYKHGLKSESFFLVGLAVSTFAAVIMNFVLGYKFLISGVAVISLIFYYMYFATQTLTRDALTDAFNRHSFYSDIPAMKKKDMFIISMDLNGLKKINDTLGHDEGDKAILAVTQSAFNVISDRCRFYRMGGDEFQILYPGADEKRVQKLCEDLKKETEAKGYSVACGYMEYKKDGNFDEALRRADELMYEDKVRMKQVREN
ncbi:MAG: GGDEF domain-containing protein [Oscillospiraceae bacterium]|nr:GGDEF domain-containing protein [Oscillospiraceae bacterium]